MIIKIKNNYGSHTDKIYNKCIKRTMKNYNQPVIKNK